MTELFAVQNESISTCAWTDKYKIVWRDNNEPDQFEFYISQAIIIDAYLVLHKIISDAYSND